MKVDELSREDLRAIVQEAVEEALLDLLGDPDAGVELREDVRDRLEASLERVRRGERGIPLDDVAARVD